MDKKDEEKLKDKNKEKKRHHHHHHKDEEREKEKETSKKDKEGKVWAIKLSDNDIGETLGTGSSGRVKISKNKKTGEFVAMKIMKKMEILKSKQADHISNEIKILSMIEHLLL